MHSSWEPISFPELRPHGEHTLKPHQVKQTRIVTYALHFPCPQARKIRNFDLCLHFKPGQAWEPLAEFGLPVLSCRACRSLLGGTMASTRSRGGCASAQILGFRWCSWSICGTLRGWVTGRGDRLRETCGDIRSISAIWEGRRTLTRSVGRT